MNTFFLFFIGLPALEIFLMIKIGGKIGALNTVLLIFFTAIIGVYFARLQGIQTIKSGLNSLYKNETGFLEEKIFDKKHKIALQDYYVAQSSVSPNLKTKLRYKAFDVDSYNNDYEIVLTFTGSLGVYDAGKSGSVANAALKRAKIAQARKNAVKINNAARLGTIESQINSTLARLSKINDATKKYQSDLKIIEEK